MIEVSNLTQSFGKDSIVLHNLSFRVDDGDYVSLTGRSGSGKTTLLYCISSLDRPTKGDVVIDGVSLLSMNEHELHVFRNQSIGFVFQFHYLLPELTALENILMPAKKAKKEKKAKEFAMHLLNRFELSEHAHKRPGELSGGQAQRVAIIRAMAMKPKYLFADEPTGSLDSSNAKIIMDIFDDLNQKEGTTIICVTHDQDFAKSANRNMELFDGRFVNT